MNLQIFPTWRQALLALGVLAGMSLPAAAAPLAAGPVRSALVPSVSEGRTDITPVHSSERRYWKKKRNYRRHYRDHRRYDRRYHRRVRPRLYLPPLYPNYRYYEPRRYQQRLGSRHVRWCYNRYRSYRAWNNTFQPYHGPRRQCRSPYWP